MKVLYFDCAMGAAGDMLMGALYELCPDREGFLRDLNGALAGLAEVSAEPDSKRGIRGTHMRVLIGGREEGAEPPEEPVHHHHHHHVTAAELAEKIDALSLPERVKANAKAVYGLVAQAESRVHGQPVENIHFHELGSLDALADILGVCLLMERIGPEKVFCSPIRVGSGTVKCAHGILPVPAPATELLLRGLPIYAGEIQGEMCTPTGAALLRHFADGFGPLPLLRVEAAGCGTGTKDFETANLLRALLGQTEEQMEDEVLELSCNLDDMTAEALAFASEELFKAGALDVWTEAIGMKKGRPGLKLSCLCRPEQREALLKALFLHTSTLGVRENRCRRAVLERSAYTKETALGPVRFKQAQGWGVCREKPEYEDLARLAREKGLSLRQAEEQARKEQ